ncbi:ABC transporter permease [Cellulosilyticum ruminicola]|uniref:ABC transporter permease n=1 Tax=Cellulosilyticum ruminicola TaxID=425254 RepID=UPI0006CFE278|nr:ABC transporter permease [Cellulosilyticum ruminicola]
MNIRETVKMALKQLLGNKGRTFLTMLGMFIGIGSVIAILALGTGFQDFFKDKFINLGLGVFSIEAKEDTIEYLITPEDVQVIRNLEEIRTAIRGTSEECSIRDAKGKEFDTWITGVEDGYMTLIKPITLRAGRNISVRDQEAGSQVLLIADIIGKAYFGNIPYEDMIGNNIEIVIEKQPVSFQVIGIYKTESDVNQSQKELEKYYGLKEYITPFKALNNIIGAGEDVSMIAGLIKDGYDQTSVATRIGQILNRRHHLKDGYSIMSVAQIVDMVDKIMSVLTMFVSALASISLIVGGVGIMNIMLVTVKERTREIGIRKALGASNKLILRQFVIEALLITVIAGFIGMIIGYIGAITIGANFGIQAKFSSGMVVFSTVTSVSIGLIFGVYPAYQAARLDPIEALRAD